MSIGDPVDHHYGNTFWGSWMQDTAPDPPHPDMIWVTKHIVGDVVYGKHRHKIPFCFFTSHGIFPLFSFSYFSFGKVPH